MASGTIVRLLIDKGFGFIRDEGGVEHFFHRSAVRGAVFELLREGQRVGFTIEPDGRVDDVSVDAWSRDEEMLAACVRSRVSSLFFDPAPPSEAVRIDRTFYFCPDEQGGLCRLGGARPLGGEASEDLLTRIDAGLSARDDRLEACAREIGGQPAVLDVRLEVGTDGRVMAGQLRESFPASTGLRRCAVGPLLGARIEGELPDERMQVRYVYRLGAVGDVRSAQR